MTKSERARLISAGSWSRDTAPAPSWDMPPSPSRRSSPRGSGALVLGGELEPGRGPGLCEGPAGVAHQALEPERLRGVYRHHRVEFRGIGGFEEQRDIADEYFHWRRSEEHTS